MNLREIKSLRKLNHVNIVKLKEVIRANDELYFVFEYCEKNIFDKYLKSNLSPMSENSIKSVIY